MKHDDLIETVANKNRLTGMARGVRTLIRVLAATLAVAFAWLKFTGFPFPRLDSDLAATFFLRLGLVTYYFGWLFGVLLDTRDEETLLSTAPNKGRIPPVAVAICLTITAAFGILCWVDTYEKFAAALAGFWILNLIAWRYLLAYLTRPAIRESVATY